MVKVQFSDGREVEIEKGAKLSEAIKKAGYLFDFPCGGNGTCGKCRVKAALLSAGQKETSPGVLACSHEIRQDMWVEIPDQTGDPGAVILTGGLRPSQAASPTAMFGKYGLAVDIGTTTVVGYLLDLASGREAAHGAELNRQRVFGADVISRITAAQDSAGNLTQMQDLVIETINSIVAQVLNETTISGDQIEGVTLAGNTCMHHLVLGLNPKSLGRAPFQPTVRHAVTLAAQELGLMVNPSASTWVFPVVAGFVGGDTVAAVMATKLHKRPGISLLVDIGTNGELVLNVNGQMTACSAAAGPALEGAQITCGMRAETGAITRVSFGPAIEWDTVGSAAPRGLCGSGLIDLAGELVRWGIVTKKGGIIKSHQFNGPQNLQERIVPGDKGNKFVLVPALENNGREISLTQDDILQIQLAKGALHTSMELLVRQAGISGGQVGQVFLAGAFGNFMDQDQALEIGLFPSWARGKIIPVGNAAGEGAKMALISPGVRREAEIISRDIGFLELAGTSQFSEAFIDGILFRNAR